MPDTFVLSARTNGGKLSVSAQQSGVASRVYRLPGRVVSRAAGERVGARSGWERDVPVGVSRRGLGCRWVVEQSLASAALRAGGLLADLALATFLAAEFTNAFWMRRRPVPRQHRFIVRLASQQTSQKVIQISADVQVIAMSAAGQRQEPGTSLAARDTAREEPVLAAQSDLFHELFAFVVVHRQLRVSEVTPCVIRS